jgi:Tol biopolymer transport system component
MRKVLSLVVCLICVGCTTPITRSGEALVLGVVRGRFFAPSIYSVNADGSGEIATELPAGLSAQPNWSPDNKWIVYSTLYSGTELPEKAEIYLMSADGHIRKRITDFGSMGGSLSPNWSPDGLKIVFFAYGTKAGSSGIYLMNVECLLQETDCDPQPVFLILGQTPDWSPSGDLIVYEQKGNIFVMNVDGKYGPVNLTPGMKFCSDPQWSPNGDKIAFSCFQADHHDNPFNIFVVDKDGANLVNLTGGIGSNILPRWSPSGSKIAFVSDREELGKTFGWDSSGISNEVFLLDLTSAQVIRLTSNSDEMVRWLEWLPSNSPQLESDKK